MPAKNTNKKPPTGHGGDDQQGVIGFPYGSHRTALREERAEKYPHQLNREKESDSFYDDEREVRRRFDKW